MTRQEALEKAIKAMARPGTPNELAEAVGRTGAAVRYWKTNGVPHDMVIPVCDACGWAVTPHELRPDLYPNKADGIPKNTSRRGR